MAGQEQGGKLAARGVAGGRAAARKLGTGGGIIDVLSMVNESFHQFKASKRSSSSALDF